MEEKNMPLKVAAALLLLLLGVVGNAVAGSFFMAGLEIALLIGLLLASPSCRNIFLFLAVTELLLYPGLFLLTAGFVAATGRITVFSVILLGFGVLKAAYVVWVLRHNDTKRWIKAKHPNEIISGLED